MRRRRQPNGHAELLRQLWEAAVKLRGSIEPPDYKRYVLPIIFLRCLSLRFDRRRDELSRLIEVADDIKVRLDDALEALEKAYPERLRGLLPRIYAGSNLPRESVTGIINLFSKDVFRVDHGGEDLIGRVYEYFIGEFANSEGKRGGEYFTPVSIVKTLVPCSSPSRASSSTPAAGRAGCSSSPTSSPGTTGSCRSSARSRRSSRLVKELEEQFAEGGRLVKEIRANLARLDLGKDPS